MIRKIDTSNYSLVTPVLVYIGERGIWIPECKGYPPIQCYLSIEKVISIMNRGITVEFPKQSPEKEVSRKIEELLHKYEDKQDEIYEKKGIEVGTNVSQAVEMIQIVNETAVKTKEEIEDEENNKIFDYSKESSDIVKHLTDTEFTANLLAEDDKNMSAEERLEKAERKRKSKESIVRQRKAALAMLSEETNVLKRVLQDAKYTEADMQYNAMLDLSESITGYTQTRTNKK